MFFSREALLDGLVNISSKKIQLEDLLRAGPAWPSRASPRKERARV